VKPILLTMSAFGPFPGRIGIDFARYEGEGLFLLSGETGAGKTTVFDAISYALYGEVSGGTRGTYNLRSDFAQPETETFVELLFEHMGQRYTIRRNPEYLRPSKKSRDGFVAQKSGVVFQMPERTLEGASDVDGRGARMGAVEELLRVNYDQFKQIMMLAQGEFLALLTASSNDRTEIMRKVFDTGIYARVQARLAALAKEAERERDLLAGELASLTAHTITDVDYSDARLAQLTEQREALDAEHGKWVRTIEQAVELNRHLDALEKHKFALLALESAHGRVKAELQDLAALEPQREAARREESELAAALPNYAALTANSRELEAQVKALETAQGRQAKLSAAMAGQRDALTGLKAELEGLAAAPVAAIEAKTALKAAEDFGAELTKLKAAQADFVRKNDAFTEAQRVYFNIKIRYDGALAGRLAAELETGRPCPVCGSFEHPAKAEPAHDAPSQDEYEGSESRYNAALADSIAAKALRESLTAGLGIAPGALGAAMAEHKARLDSLATKKRAADEAAARHDALQKNLKTLETDLRSGENQEKELNDTVGQLSVAVSGLRATVDTLRLGLKHPTEAEAKGRLAAVRAQLDADKKQRDDTTAREQDIRARMAAAAAHIDSSGREAQGQADKLELPCAQVDSSAFEASRDAASIRLKEAEEALRTARNARETNARIAGQLAECAVKLEAAEARLGDAEILSNTANGRVAGQNKLQFETYVQQVYFDIILAEANVRFGAMTDGRYQLVRQSAERRQGQGGLDIDVFDSWSQKGRPAKTLSGGESFKAALSLALGLSDVVQAHSGGVQIEAMFIDEGFGSLDSDSLDSAMDVIAGLADGSRLVGIISHVDILKERIPQKIIVRRDKQGSTIEV